MSMLTRLICLHTHHLHRDIIRQSLHSSSLGKYGLLSIANGESRCFSSSNKTGNQEIVKIDPNKEIKGYFKEDFNVKGKTKWIVTQGVKSAIIIYVSSSIVCAASSFMLINTDLAVDFICRFNIIAHLDWWGITGDDNPKRTLATGIYLFTEPMRILCSISLRNYLTNFLYKLKIYKEPKFEKFKGEADYDEEKINL